MQFTYEKMNHLFYFDVLPCCLCCGHCSSTQPPCITVVLGILVAEWFVLMCTEELSCTGVCLIQLCSVPTSRTVEGAE